MNGEPPTGRATRAFGPDVVARLRAAADRLAAYPFKPWFYGDSIGFEGLLEASTVLGDASYRDFAAGFITDWAARRQRDPDDNTAPGRVMCELAADARGDELTTAAVRLAEELLERRRIDGCAVTFEDAGRSLREPYGDLALDTEDRALLADPGAGIYLDCLHFDPPFYSALGTLLGDQRWFERAVEEAIGYVRLLQDPGSGLFHHFWLERTGRAYALGWGRGQGWALLGLLDVLDDVPSDQAGRPVIAKAASSLLEAMLSSQQPDGSWSAVVGVAASGAESSTAAFMTVGFLRAARLGIGERGRLLDAADRAWAATLVELDGGGLLTGVSAAVYSSTLDAHYHRVPRGFDVPWGQGPLLVAAAEMADLHGSADVRAARHMRPSGPSR